MRLLSICVDIPRYLFHHAYFLHEPIGRRIDLDQIRAYLRVIICSVKITMKTIRISKLRIFIQSVFALLCLGAGYQFFHFYLWAVGKSDVYVPRPPSVEGFLPISALLGLKRFVLTGRYDDVHPAGLTIFLAALTIALLLRKGFCGWICPVGFASNLIEKGGKKIQFIQHLPPWLDLPLRSIKYFLLAFFCYVILWKMDLSAVEAFIYSPYNKIVDGKMLLLFLEPSKLTLQVLVALILISFVLRNFWCRYLCPYGALLGLLGFISPAQVKRKPELLSRPLSAFKAFVQSSFTFLQNSDIFFVHSKCSFLGFVFFVENQITQLLRAFRVFSCPNLI